MANNQKIKIKMLENNINNYTELAEKLNTNRQNVYNKLKNRTKWNYNDIQKLIVLLNLTSDDVFEIFFKG
nr:MAG TPA: SOS-response transcriptional repressor [Caudoviricetes sp.]